MSNMYYDEKSKKCLKCRNGEFFDEKSKKCDKKPDCGNG